MLKGAASLFVLASLLILSASFALAQDRPNQTCQVVINVIVNNEPVQVGGDDVVISGDGNDLSENQIIIISQSLNVSPAIVQNCIQNFLENEGNGGTAGTTGGTNGTTGGTNGTTGATGTTGGTGTTSETPNDANGDGIPDDVMQGTIPGKVLPFTGGFAWWYGLLALPYAALLAWRLKR